MDKLFILEFALKNINLHRLRAVLTLTGVIIGISAIVFLLSFAFGIERLVTNEVTSGDAFTLIDVGTGNSKIVSLTDSTVSNIKNIPGIEDIYGMAAVGGKLIVTNKSMDVSFFGATPKFLDKAGIRVSKGKVFLEQSNDIIVNTAFLKFWDTNTDILGRKLTFNILVPKELIDKPDNLEAPDQTYQVIGIINDDSAPKVYSSMNVLRNFGVNSFSQLKVEVDSKEMVPEIRKTVENMGLKTQYVGDTVSQINQVFGIFRIILAGFGLITLIVSILGMFNTLTISLLERTRELALMKILGMQRKDITNVFLTESVVIGLTGGILGLILGTLVGRIVNFILNHYAQSLGGEQVSIFYLPISFMVMIILASLIVGILTGLYPSKRAAKINPLDMLRYE